MRRVGVDLDNTLVDYSSLFDVLAREFDVHPGGAACVDHRTVRECARASSGGEQLWQKFQSLAYGSRMHEARPYADAVAVLRDARAVGVKVFVVSHKTRYAAADFSHKCDLRLTAMDWLRANGLFDSGQPVLDSLGDVQFADSREEKVERIAALGLDVFIDDLPEVFSESKFPRFTQRILFDSGGRGIARGKGGVATARSWREVAEEIGVSASVET